MNSQRTLHDLPDSLSNRKFLRKSMTPAEIILWARIKGRGLGVKFRRQHGIGPYIVDFYCAKERMIIEIDGQTHDDVMVLERDGVRDKFLHGLGYCVLRYTNEQIHASVESVLTDIASHFHSSPDPSSTKEGS